jgi:NTP pyrophosphatase (non-canonical NTP hydrolase)
MNSPTPAKVQYLLDKLQEEAAEVIQAVSKIRRFGPHQHHPDRTTTNLQELTGELEDLQAIILALTELQYFDPKPSTTSTIKKFNTLMSS